MKKISFLVLFLASLVSVKAQTVGYQLGAPAKEKLDGRSGKILTYDKSNTIVLLEKKKNYSLEAFDNEFTHQASVELKLPMVNKVPHEMVDVFGVEGKLILVTRVYNKTENRLIIYGYKLNTDGSYDAEAAILDEIEGKPGEEIKVKHRFELTTDRKLLLMLRDVPVEKGAAPRFMYKMWDNILRNPVNRIMTLPTASKSVTIAQIVPDGFSNLYFTAKVEDLPNPKRRVPELPYRWTIYNFDVDDDKLIEYPIQLGEAMFVFESAIYLDKPQEKLHAAGFFGTSQKSGITGCYITTTDIITNQVLRKTTEPLSKDFTAIHKTNIRKFRDTSVPRRLIRGVADVVPTAVLTREDGNVFLIGEITRSNKEVPSGQNPANYPDEKSKITNYVQGVVVVNFNARGSIDWQATISLNQATLNDQAASNSFVRGVLRDKIALVYNDNPANEDINDPAKQLTMEKTGGKNSKALIAYVDKYGKTDVEALFTDKEEESVIHPYSSFQIARNQFIALASSPKGYRIIKFTYY